jgi:hypothetical protein
MAQTEVEPVSGKGLPLLEAVLTFASADLCEKYTRAVAEYDAREKTSPGWHNVTPGYIDVDGFHALPDKLTSAKAAAYAACQADVIEMLRSEELQAWGERGHVAGPWERIVTHSWEKLRIRWDSGRIVAPGAPPVTYFNVRLCRGPDGKPQKPKYKTFTADNIEAAAKALNINLATIKTGHGGDIPKLATWLEKKWNEQYSAATKGTFYRNVATRLTELGRSAKKTR